MTSFPANLWRQMMGNERFIVANGVSLQRANYFTKGNLIYYYHQHLSLYTANDRSRQLGYRVDLLSIYIGLLDYHHMTWWSHNPQTHHPVHEYKIRFPSWSFREFAFPVNGRWPVETPGWVSKSKCRIVSIQPQPKPGCVALGCLTVNWFYRFLEEHRAGQCIGTGWMVI